jgi:hypothetical protein
VDGSSIQGRLQDGATIKDLKYLFEGKIFPVPTLFITSLPEDEQMSKHGGGGRYDVILEFEGEQIKKFQKKERKKEIFIYIYICEKEIKKYE